MRLLILPVLFALASCSGPGSAQTAANEQDDRSWGEWHADTRAEDAAITDAVNEPNGGDFAKAVELTRASKRPAVVKQFQIGMIIMQSFNHPGTRRPPETIGQGLRMVEDAVTQPGEPRKTGPQQLRLIFERGWGQPPHAIPIDPVVADCWHRLENGGAGDPERCVALRRQRWPQFETGAAIEAKAAPR